MSERGRSSFGKGRPTPKRLAARAKLKRLLPEIKARPREPVYRPRGDGVSARFDARTHKGP